MPRSVPRQDKYIKYSEYLEAHKDQAREGLYINIKEDDDNGDISNNDNGCDCLPSGVSNCGHTEPSTKEIKAMEGKR